MTKMTRSEVTWLIQVGYMVAPYSINLFLTGITQQVSSIMIFQRFTILHFDAWIWYKRGAWLIIANGY